MSIRSMNFYFVKEDNDHTYRYVKCSKVKSAGHLSFHKPLRGEEPSVLEQIV